MISDLGFEEARRFYDQARRQAFERIRTSLVRRGVVEPALAISGLDSRAANTWATAWRGTPHWSEKGGFHWGLLRHKYCRKPRNFHCALWHGDPLCGLAVGRVSEAHEAVSVHFMEGSPRPDHPLRGNVAAVVFACAHLYAVALGAKCLVLKDPDPDLDAFYAEMGFGVALRVGNSRYCRREV